MENLWVRGGTRSGKTTALVKRFVDWVSLGDRRQLAVRNGLVLAANNRAQRQLAETLTEQSAGAAFVSKTPVGFMADEVELFFPLICESLKIEPKFPLRLRPEMEQKLARELWADSFAELELNLGGRSQERLVRRMLDLLQLAGAAGVPPEEIPQRLVEGQLSLLSGEAIFGQNDHLLDFTEIAGDLLLEWREWCLARGFVTYGIIYELYWRYLLPNAKYQGHLVQRYGAIFADDVNDYPAIAKDLFTVFLDHDVPGTFTENPDGKIRLGLNADPDYLAQLATSCEIVDLKTDSGLGKNLIETVQTQLAKPTLSDRLPDQIQSMQSISRAQLLQKVAGHIQNLVKKQAVSPEDIAIIAPGLDEVARYTLIETLAQSEITVEPLNEQRPINSSPLGRSPLILLALIYPGCGRLISTSEVAEMLIMLSQTPAGEPIIDPVRAGLIVDYCFQPDPEQPQLLPASTMARGDRLGYQVTTEYEKIRAWIAAIQAENNFSSDAILKTLNQALQDFYLSKMMLRYDQMATLRELTETAQHFFQCGDRLEKQTAQPQTIQQKLSTLIQLIKEETITANPNPLSTLNAQPNPAITLATIFQYRTARLHHKYQFWLDAGSPLWEKGGAATLFAYGVFQQAWDGEPWSMAAESEGDRQRIQHIVQDLLGRTDQQLYLCHSDLSISGTEQLGPLYPLVQSTQIVI
ncbi:MAG: hypothetical protein WBB82_13280 [Limnothrix sp.]